MTNDLGKEIILIGTVSFVYVVALPKCQHTVRTILHDTSLLVLLHEEDIALLHQQLLSPLLTILMAVVENAIESRNTAHGFLLDVAPDTSQSSLELE